MQVLCFELWAQPIDLYSCSWVWMDIHEFSKLHQNRSDLNSYWIMTVSLFVLGPKNAQIAFFLEDFPINFESEGNQGTAIFFLLMYF